MYSYATIPDYTGSTYVLVVASDSTVRNALINLTASESAYIDNSGNVVLPAGTIYFSSNFFDGRVASTNYMLGGTNSLYLDSSGNLRPGSGASSTTINWETHRGENLTTTGADKAPSLYSASGLKHVDLLDSGLLSTNLGWQIDIGGNLTLNGTISATGGNWSGGTTSLTIGSIGIGSSPGAYNFLVAPVGDAAIGATRSTNTNSAYVSLNPAGAYSATSPAWSFGIFANSYAFAVNAWNGATNTTVMSVAPSTWNATFVAGCFAVTQGCSGTSSANIFSGSTAGFSGQVTIGDGTAYGNWNPSTSVLDAFAPGKFIYLDSNAASDWGVKMRGLSGSNLVDIFGFYANGGTGRISIGSLFASYYPVIMSGNKDALSFTTAGAATFLSTVANGTNSYTGGSLGLSGNATAANFTATGTMTATLGDIGIPAACYSDSASQSTGGVSSTNSILLRTEEITSSYITHSNSTNPERFTLTVNGLYRIIFSACVTASGVNKHINIWLIANGTNVARSNTRVELPISGEAVISVELFYNVTASHYLSLCWASTDDATMELTATAAAAGPPAIPASPSIIVTINKVSK